MTSTTELVSPFSAPAEAAVADRRGLPVSCRLARGARERALHARIRREVFVVEQRLFDDDRDGHDDDPATRHALGLYGDVVAGVVRFYPLDEPGLWKGDRLAVLRPYRRHRLGGPLVNFAVRTAGRLGGTRMVAHVQPPNVGFFERLGWHRVGAETVYVGRPHQQMAVALR